MDNLNMNHMKKEISCDSMKEIQLHLVECLDQYCESHGLRYYLSGGSLLGAVRHQGYIPWDDDIDVVMPRTDYERLLRDFNHSRGDICIISAYSSPNYYLPYAKIVDTNTILRESYDCNFDLGINIDVFPLDNLSDSIIMANFLFDTILWSRIKLMIKLTAIKKNRAWYKNAILRVGKWVLSNCSANEIAKEIDKKSRSIKNTDFSRYICVAVNAIYGKKEIMNRTLFMERIKLPFEGRAYWVPKEYDAILTRLFGDYMTPPPIKDRRSHHEYEAYWKL